MKVSSFCLLSATLAVASAAVLPRQQLANVYTSCAVEGSVALTFDDGPYIWNKEIVDTLNDAGAKGTFFVNGYNYACIYDDDSITRLQYALASGHQVASHTWNHGHLPTYTQDQLQTQFSLTNDALLKTCGILPAFFRPPYGEYSDLVREVAAQYGLGLVNWDTDSGDSVGATVEQSEGVYTDLANRHPSTILVLNHETYQTTAEQVLPFALDALKKAGYTNFVTVAECLGMEPYQQKTQPGSRDDTWTCAGTPAPGS
ncbi:carbohydrate esterase family 4 protein [Botryobasidium botryosum FD-172 SS1]|uniref:Carbohydrate esterase family 4 protein n=1 Tax=Botryobasidium botryosum (strain FD-172 SS1) TaxID=930990 RepID=A0A067MR05_BOTB1|nr:carbohydrate esterase family 4 protein [Botryobasidium botryosum FD-172 SS1]